MKVDHFNTHLCVCNGDQLLASAKTIADTIAANRRSPSSPLLSPWSSSLKRFMVSSQGLAQLSYSPETSMWWVTVTRTARWNPNSKRRNIFNSFQAIRYLTGQLENSPVVLVDSFRVVIWSFFYLKNQRLCIISRWNGFLLDHHFEILSLSSGKWRKWGRNDFPGSWQDRLRPCRGFGQNQPLDQPTPPESYLQNSCYVHSPTNKDVYL